MERYCGMALDCTFRGVVAFVAVRGVIAAGELPVARGAAAGAAGSSAPQYSNTVPFPSPLLLLGDAKTLLRKRKLCPKKLCHPRGSPHPLGSIWGPKRSIFMLDSGSLAV